MLLLRCDNEPAILQLQRLATKTRQSMGLKTRMDNSVAYDHGNSLAENGIARVRQLAASLMHQLHGRLGLQLSTGSAIWTWALRHAEWLISRFSVLRGATPYELALGRQYKGDLCEYGEPVYGYVHPGTNKAAARWRRALFLGNADSQNSFVLFDGQSIVLSKSIRRNQYDLEEPSCILPSLQVLLMAIQIRFWCQDFAHHEKGHSSICKFRSAIGAD